MSGHQLLGVSIVTFNSSDVIENCLDSLLMSRGASLRVVVTDNASTDNTLEIMRSWACRRMASDGDFSFCEMSVDDQKASATTLTILTSPYNGGYAYGVNQSVKYLLSEQAIDLFWILNPDCEVEETTAEKYLKHAADRTFSLMCGRTLYKDQHNIIQTDGGRVSLWTGVCSSANAGLSTSAASIPDVETIDFIPGSNAVATRIFIEKAGLMEEDYFLYYEEVDWALRRGDLPLRILDDAIVFHHGGTSIGSGSITRRATPFANFFNYRNRIRFLCRHNPIAVPIGIAYASAKALQLAMTGAVAEAWAILCGVFNLGPPKSVRSRIAVGKAQEIAFGRSAR